MSVEESGDPLPPPAQGMSRSHQYLAPIQNRCATFSTDPGFPARSGGDRRAMVLAHSCGRVWACRGRCIPLVVTRDTRRVACSRSHSALLRSSAQPAGAGQSVMAHGSRARAAVGPSSALGPPLYPS